MTDELCSEQQQLAGPPHVHARGLRFREACCWRFATDAGGGVHQEASARAVQMLISVVKQSSIYPDGMRAECR